jgi:hypothetical protein
LFVGDSGKTSVLETAGKHANVSQYILVLLGDLLEGKFISHLPTRDKRQGCQNPLRLSPLFYHRDCN